jgi:hypothetical protein
MSTMVMANLAWAEVDPGHVLIATRDRAWLHRLAPGDPFAHPMCDAGTPEATMTLLDAAIGAFQRQRLRQIAPPLTVEAYVERLLDNYVAGHSTPRLLRRVADRFVATERPDLAAWAREAARAEDHEHLILADLAELDYPVELVESVPGSARVQAAVAYFEECVENDRPVSCLGYVYALERPAALVSASYVEAIETLLGPTVNACRCVRAHSALGVEPDHVETLLNLIVSLPGEDRTCVARAVYDTSRILFADAYAEAGGQS